MYSVFGKAPDSGESIAKEWLNILNGLITNVLKFAGSNGLAISKKEHKSESLY
jgi:hypothetical protein